MIPNSLLKNFQETGLTDRHGLKVCSMSLSYGAPWHGPSVRAGVFQQAPKATTRIALLVLCTAVAATAAGLSPPRLGCFRDDTGRVRPVLGVTGNFVLGEVEQADALSAACWGAVSLIKKESALEWRRGALTRTWPAPAGPAVFGFTENGSAALACFQESWACIEVDQRGSLSPLLNGRSLGDGVLAIANPRPGQLAIVVQRESRLVLLALENGRVTAQTELAGISTPVLLLPDGTLLYPAGQDLVRRATDGSERRLALPSPVAALEFMGAHWVRIELKDGGHMAVAVVADHESLYRLPGVPR